MGKFIKYTVIIAVLGISAYALYHVLKSRGQSQLDAKEA
jgi:hypothetical protein